MEGNDVESIAIEIHPSHAILHYKIKDYKLPMTQWAIVEIVARRYAHEHYPNIKLKIKNKTQWQK